MKKEYDYMDDSELEAFIAEVEHGGMIAPPVYLKELIMEKAEQEKEACGQGMELRKTDSGRNVVAEKETAKAAKIQFWIYSLKIAAAAAAAMFCLITMPADLSGGGMTENDRIGNDRIEKQIEEDTERYQQEKKKALAGEERADRGIGGFLNALSGNQSLKGVNGILNGVSNWFGMEEKMYD